MAFRFAKSKFVPDTRKLFFWRAVSALSILTLLVTVALFAFKTKQLKVEEQGLASSEMIDMRAPFAKQIKAIISPLRYSGIDRLMHSDVTIELDFANKTWTLKNVHRYDAEGNVIIGDNRYGLCGELAAYTGRKVAPLFGNDYEIEYVRSEQAGFFLSPQASHMVVRVTKKTFPKDIYIIDPSFHRYGTLEDFEDYLFYEASEELPIFRDKIPDEMYRVGTCSPLIIKKQYLLALLVEPLGGKFDEDNFVLALTATKRYHFAGRYVCALRMNHGEAEQFENKQFIGTLLKPEEYEILRDKMAKFFDSILKDLSQSSHAQ
jgi:hypothetical protein